MVTLTIDDALWGRVCAAMANTYGLQTKAAAVRAKDNSIVTPEVIETQDECARRKIAEFVKQTVANFEARAAMKAQEDLVVQAQNQAVAKVNTDFPSVL